MGLESNVDRRREVEPQSRGAEEEKEKGGKTGGRREVATWRRGAEEQGEGGDCETGFDRQQEVETGVGGRQEWSRTKGNCR
ncbi:unnamed protein product [Linum trigynum]|uniref:Uncharacterized protein n=1 Tax=Linum trigynum TaxID=586398 RepID=A0AAV2CE58_9ROSI